MSGRRSCCGARRSPWTTWRIPTALGATTRPDPHRGFGPEHPAQAPDAFRNKGNFMMESVIGLLADRESAQRVRSALLEAGCAEKDVVVFDRSAGNSLVGELAERGLAPARVDLYARAVQRGGVLVAAEAEKA